MYFYHLQYYVPSVLSAATHHLLIIIQKAVRPIPKRTSVDKEAEKHILLGLIHRNIQVEVEVLEV